MTYRSNYSICVWYNPDMPKFIIVIRHGELENPRNIAYNRDSVMDRKDIIHLSEIGKKQMQDLGKIILDKQFRVILAKVSPETRAQESIAALLESMGLTLQPEIDPDLDDNEASGPYKKRMSLDDIKKFGGNVYEGAQWAEFNHEKAEAVLERMKKVFFGIAQRIGEGETAIMLSHGDPTAWLLNDIVARNVPAAKDLRSSAIYPNKGEGYQVTLDFNNQVLEGVSLNSSNTINNKY